MKAAQVRGMTVDQLNDELVKLKRSSSTCASRRPLASLRTRRG